MAMLERGVGRELAGNVFPTLASFIGGGAVVGAAVGIIVAELMGRAGESLLPQLDFCRSYIARGGRTAIDEMPRDSVSDRV
jgi:hypothetical protein